MRKPLYAARRTELNRILKRLQRELGHLANKKHDIRNKIVHGITGAYDVVARQDDDVRGWQRRWGRRVYSTGIGGLMSALDKAHTPVLVDRKEPTTQRCSRCRHVKAGAERLGLGDRTYHCEACGFLCDRDLNSAFNDEDEARRRFKLGPAERRTGPADGRTSALLGYLNGIPGVRASLVGEAGSPRF